MIRLARAVAAALGALLGMPPAVALVPVLPPNATLAAQMVPASGPGLAPGRWLDGWSPLRPLADLPRPAPGAGFGIPGLLTAPAPRTGLFWTTGNPAALPFEVADAWSGYRVETAAAEGEYRRPLDPRREERTRLSVQGWSPAGPGRAAMGRLVLDRVLQGAPALADIPTPYGSSPLVVLDTANSDLGSTAARIEGALGVRMGRFGFGLAAGFDAVETRTVEAPVPQTVRGASPATVAGVTWSPFRSDALVLGVHGRFQRTTYAVDLYSLAAPTTVFHLSGFAEPTPINLVSAFYDRDIMRTGREVGTGVALEVAGTRILLFGDVGRAREEQSSLDVNDPPVDSWAADQLRYGAAARRSFNDRRLIVTGSVTRTELSGETRLHEQDDEVVFTVEENAWDLMVDARWRLAAWRVGARAVGTYRDRLGVDSTLVAGSRVESWNTGASVEVARSLGVNLTAAAGIALADYHAAGAVLDPRLLGTVYGAYVAPEIGLRATDSRTRALRLTLGWSPAPGRVSTFLQARWGASTPNTAFFVPKGPGSGEERTGWGVTLGVNLIGKEP